MMDLRQIVALWSRDGARVLATVIRVAGSSYRRPGARLLITDSGTYAGTISGGCLESEVLRKATWKVQTGAVVERYSTLFDDTAEIPFGLGCGGVVDLLLEPANTPECNALLSAMERSLHGEQAKVVTWLPCEGKALRRAILTPDGELLFASQNLDDKKLACTTGLVPGKEYEGRFVEWLHAPQRLFVVGAGDDAKPVVAMAALMGWSVTVIDGRSHLAKAERFPAADRVICASDLSGLEIRSQDAVAVMTHSYEQDRSVLSAMLPLAPRYLGLLGARHRSALLVTEAAAAAGLSIADCCDRIWAPVGLDLGGDGTEAIALAIIAEVQAVCMGRAGASRRLMPEDIKRYVSEGDNARYLETQCATDLAR